jgi:hypothetical protein
MKALLRGLGGVAKIAFGIVGAIILLIIVIAVAASAGKSKSTGPTSSPALVTTSTPETRTSSSPPPAPQVFKGNGDENLGTISVSTPSTLHWSCRSCSVFSVVGSGGTVYIGVDSQEHTSGVTAVEPGTYHSVGVTVDEGEGSTGWTITISPGT